MLRTHAYQFQLTSFSLSKDWFLNFLTQAIYVYVNGIGEEWTDSQTRYLRMLYNTYATLSIPVMTKIQGNKPVCGFKTALFFKFFLNQGMQVVHAESRVSTRFKARVVGNKKLLSLSLS